MKLSLVSIEKDGIIRVAADGNITATDFDAGGKNPFEQLMGINWKTNRVLLNFENVTYVDSSAIGWLISCHKAFKDGGGILVVHSVQPTVRQILDVLKIGKVVPLVPSETEARALAATGGNA
jgi:anti-anti-sigma factor